MKLALFAVALVAVAPKPLAFDLKDPKGVNSVQWLMDSPLEPIAGKASEISGTVVYDEEHPEKSTGKVVIQAKSMEAPVALMTQHMHGKDWLDVKTYPTMSFTVKKVQKGETLAGSTAGVITGDFKLHGVTKEITVPVEIRLVKGGLAAKMGGRMKGDVFRIRTEFRIKRSDYGVGEQFPSVGDEVELRCAFVGIRAEKQPGVAAKAATPKG
ncbi:YceI family protein [bacterium]|nr:MAG: YceI family protein [bacterium]